MKIAYILSRYPTLTETFIKVELQTLLSDGVALRVYPLRGAQNTAWVIESRPDCGISECVRRFGFALSPSNLAALIQEACRSPRRFLHACRVFWCSRPAGWLAAAKAAFILPKACRIARSIREWGAQHVHAHFANLPAATATFVGDLLSIPCSCTSHAFDLYRRDAASLGRLTEALDFVATISERNRSHYAHVLGPEIAAKVNVVHCGVDTQKFVPAGPRGGPFVSVGRLVSKKGFHVLIEAMAELVQQGQAARCRIIGEGEEHSELEELIKRLQLEGVVELAGPQPPEIVREALTEATAFVLPCLEAPDGDVDGIPVSLMEAMAMEKVVVTTGVSGITELVSNGDDGLLVPQRDATALAEMLKKLLDGEVDTVAMGRRARAKVEAKFDCRNNARLLLELIRGRAARHQEYSP